MKIVITSVFLLKVNDQVRYIAIDKPLAAKKFKKDLISNIKKDLKFPFQFKKSFYFDDENKRDYIFKGYISVYEVDSDNNIITVFGFIKYMENL